MSTLRNSVRLIGRLGNDPEVKSYGENKTKVRFSLATTDYYTDKNGERTEETQWHNVVAWNGLAQFVASYVKKGNEVAIDGKLTHHDWIDQNDQRHFMTEVLATEVLLLERRQKEQ